MSKPIRVFITLATIVAVLCTAAMAANDQSASAQASSTNDQAWIYDGEFDSVEPTEISGSIQLTAKKGATKEQDSSSVTSEFKYNNETYTLQFTREIPLSGEDFPGRGPVQFMKPVLGETDLGTLGLPATVAEVALYGRATIRRDGKIIAENQPAIVMVNQAIHDKNHEYLSSPDKNKHEISLIVPGPLSGQSFVDGFEAGAFYVYWPNVKMTLSGKITPKTKATATTPGRVGRGATAPTVGTQEPLGTINISLTNSGIRKQIGEAQSGLYVVTITNNSSTRRGLVMTGSDLCCTMFTRFSRIIAPGEKQSFRWYFAPGKVQMRDILSGRRAGTGLVDVKYGRNTSSIIFD